MSWPNGRWTCAVLTNLKSTHFSGTIHHSCAIAHGNRRTKRRSDCRPIEGPAPLGPLLLETGTVGTFPTILGFLCLTCLPFSCAISGASENVNDCSWSDSPTFGFAIAYFVGGGVSYGAFVSGMLVNGVLRIVYHSPRRRRHFSTEKSVIKRRDNRWHSRTNALRAGHTVLIIKALGCLRRLMASSLRYTRCFIWIR